MCGENVDIFNVYQLRYDLILFDL